MLCHIMEKCRKDIIPTRNHLSDDIKVRATKTQTPETLNDPEPPETLPKETLSPEDMSRLPEEYKEFTPIKNSYPSL